MVKKINFKNDIKQMWHFFGNNKKKVILAIILSFAKTIFSVTSSVFIGYLIQNTFTKIGTGQESQNALYELLIGCLIAFVCYFLYAVLFWYVYKIILQTSYTFGKFIKSMLFFKINKIPYELLESKMSGELLTRSTIDANVMSMNLALIISSIFTLPAIFIITYIALFIISPYLVLKYNFFFSSGLLC